MRQYDHRKIEKKWQAVWERKKPNLAKEKAASSATRRRGGKFYGLIEFPYPSADGLHVGHIRSNTAMDIIARKRRAEGYEVLYPIGWDAFGLPTENYAIKTGVNPAVVTKRNTDIFRRQLKALGFSFDWSREINTTDPAYYKWTQWIFLQFFKHGLAYKKKMAINWCPKDKIGLANEEVIDGKCERCGTSVEKREKEQWMLAITKYADRLDRGLDTVDFLEKIKIQQKNWIGKSEGAELDFYLADSLPKKILIGTRNKAKIHMVKSVFPKLPGVELVSLDDVPPVNDSALAEGDDFRKNARRKAEFYFKKTGLPTISTDHIIWLEKWPKDGGFIVHCRKLANPNSSRATDEEVAAWIESFVEERGSSRARFHYAIAYADGAGVRDYTTVQREYLLQKEHSNNHLDGYIFDRYMKDPKTGAFRSDQPPEVGFEHFKNSAAEFFEGVFKPIKVFTTRPDTLFGSTYLVLAPEHPLIGKIEGQITNKDEILRYIARTKEKTEMERAAENEKTGVELKGITAINPATGEKIPVWIADYVLAEYGTGAIMAVPAHDERDFAFAKKYNLPIKQVISPLFIDPTNPPQQGFSEIIRETVIVFLRNNENNTYALLDWHGSLSGIITTVMGGIETGHTAEIAARKEIEEEAGFVNATLVKKLPWISDAKYCASHKKENRHAKATTFLFEVENLKSQKTVAEKEQKIHTLVWLPQARVREKLVPLHQKFLWDQLQTETAVISGGFLLNSERFDGLGSEEAKKKITEFAGGKMVTTYKLRDWIFSRQRYWGEPIPVVHCAKCGVVPVPEKDLPVKLPKVKNYKPTETGESPLSAIAKWVNVNCPQCKGKALRETDTMPNWAGSSWYYLRYADPKNKKAFAGRKALDYWTPVDWYNGGMEHTTLHLLYSRFWHKFLFDLGLVPTSEPYKKRTSHGLILGEGGEKMSKSKGNAVNPDEIIKTYGADTLRLYEMFMGPFDQHIAWSTESLVGPRRFLEKIWRLFEKTQSPNSKHQSPNKSQMPNPKSEQLLHKTIKKVGEDIEQMRFNTAVSAMMVLANEFEKAPEVSLDQYEIFLRLLAPFAPHIAEELWSLLGYKKSIHTEPWPSYDEALAGRTGGVLVIQVNGRVRANLAVTEELSQEEVLKQATDLQSVQKWLDGKTPKKIIYLKGKLLNIVV